MVANSCPNSRAHKAEVHYQRGTLVQSRPCWQVVPFPSQSPSFPYTSPAKPSQSHSFPPTSPDEHHPTPPSYSSNLPPILSIPVLLISPTYSPVRKVVKQIPSLFCLLFYDAFSDHAFVFLCVSVHLKPDLSTPQETPTQRLSMGLKSETQV